MTMHDEHRGQGQGAGEGPSHEDQAALARVRARLVSEMASRDETRRHRRLSRGLMGIDPSAIGWASLAAALLVLVTIAGIERAKFRSGQGDLPAGSLPIAHLTPGAATDVTAAELCAGRVAPPPAIGDHIRDEVVRNYRMAHVPAEHYELDYLITPELGGATVAANLWPEPYEGLKWNALVKDHLERLLPRMVCAGKVDLRTAQQDIARDWVAAYRKYFGTVAPLREYALAGDQGDAGATWFQSNTRKLRDALFIITTMPAGRPGSARLVMSMPSVASAGVFTSNTSFD
jgi:hypothetical protein